MREGLTPKQFVMFVVSMVVLMIVLSLTNCGYHALFATEFDAKIVDLRAYGRSVCPSFRIAARESPNESTDIYYCPRFWSGGFSRANIEIGTIAQKNANSDTITFLDSNRRFIGFVAFK